MVQSPSFRISVRDLGIFVLSLPTFGFIACVLLSLIYNFEGSTATHCGVTNCSAPQTIPLVISKAPLVLKTPSELGDEFVFQRMCEPAEFVAVASAAGASNGLWFVKNNFRPWFI